MSTILKNKRAILASERKYGVASTCRKTNKLSPYDKLEGLLIAWFQQIRAAGLPVKGIILKEKALRIAEELGMDDFTASNGWLDRFRRRHGVVSCSGVARARSRSAAPRPPAAPASPPAVPSEALESPLDCREIQPVHSEGDQPWDFFGRNDAKAETPVLWPPHAKS